MDRDEDTDNTASADAALDRHQRLGPKRSSLVLGNTHVALHTLAKITIPITMMKRAFSVLALAVCVSARASAFTPGTAIKSNAGVVPSAAQRPAAALK